MPQPRVSIRLGTDGKATVVQDFADIGDAGDAQSKRIAAAFQRDSALAEAAVEKLNKTAQRFAALGPGASGATNLVNPVTGGSYAQADGAAQASARAIHQQMLAGEQAAQRLLASLDPLYAAQLRYDQALAEANTLQRQGLLSSEQFARVQSGLKNELDQTTMLYGKQGGAIGNTRIAQMELMHVVRGSVDQYAAGAAPMQIFTMHLGMLGQAAALSGESMGAFGAFMSTGWGLALTVAVVALGPLIAKLIEGGDAVDGLVGKLKKEAEQQAQNDRAHKIFEDTLDGVTEALRKNREAMGKLEDADKSAAERALDSAKAQLEKAAAIRAGTVAILEHVKAEYAQAQAQTFGAAGGAGAGAAIGIYANQVSDVQGQLDQANADLKTAQEQVREAQSLRAVELGQQDAVAGIKARYADLIESTRRRLFNEKATSQEIERQTRLLHDREDAEIKAAQERERKPGVNAGGHAIFGDQIANFFDIANRYRGLSETGDRATLQHFLGDVDPEKTAWCAAFVNAVLSAGGVAGSGSLAARSFLTYGRDDIASPQKGDIVIIKGAAGDHVGFLDSIDSKGNVSVLAGNTGNRVAEASYSASSILGIRRPPTPGEQAAVDQKAEEDRVKTLDDLLTKSHEQKLDLGDQKSLVEDISSSMKASLETAEAMLPTLDSWKLEFERIIAAQDEFQQTGEQVLDTIFNPDNWSNWGDLGKQVLKELEVEFIKMAALNPLKNLLFGSNLPTLADLFSGGTGIPSFSQGAQLPVSFNAGGNEYFSGGLTWVGEFGKERVRLPRGSKVYPAGERGRIAANDAGIGSITIPISIDATGADPAAVARLNARIDELQASLPAQIVGHWINARDRFQIR